jgi:hypothetical protein
MRDRGYTECQSECFCIKVQMMRVVAVVAEAVVAVVIRVVMVVVMMRVVVVVVMRVVVVMTGGGGGDGRCEAVAYGQEEYSRVLMFLPRGVRQNTEVSISRT